MTIHKEGKESIIGTFLVIGGVNLLLVLLWPHLFFLRICIGIISLTFFSLVVYFFRLPNISIDVANNTILAPADGKVVVIEKVNENEYYQSERIQVSIFMSPLNVHVNRYPVSGTIDYVKYHPGNYFAAWHPKSSTENERTTVVISNKNLSVLVRQIAGAMARRIVCYSSNDQDITQGAELGFIKFGSRVDLLLPLGINIKVNLEDKVTGGKTVIAEF